MKCSLFSHTVHTKKKKKMRFCSCKSDHFEAEPLTQNHSKNSPNYTFPMRKAGSFPGSTHTPIHPNKTRLVLVDHHFSSKNTFTSTRLLLSGTFAAQQLCLYGGWWGLWRLLWLALGSRAAGGAEPRTSGAVLPFLGCIKPEPNAGLVYLR